MLCLTKQNCLFSWKISRKNISCHIVLSKVKSKTCIFYNYFSPNPLDICQVPKGIFIMWSCFDRVIVLNIQQYDFFHLLLLSLLFLLFPFLLLLSLLPLLLLLIFATATGEWKMHVWLTYTFWNPWRVCSIEITINPSDVTIEGIPFITGVGHVWTIQPIRVRGFVCPVRWFTGVVASLWFFGTS